MANSDEFNKIAELISNPARRALDLANIKTLDELEAAGKKKLLSLHGFGPASIRIIENDLGRKLKD